MKILDLNPALNMFFHKLGKPTLTYIFFLNLDIHIRRKEATFSSDQVSALPHVQPNLVYHLPNKNKVLYYALHSGLMFHFWAVAGRIHCHRCGPTFFFQYAVGHLQLLLDLSARAFRSLSKLNTEVL